jgi:hypothetical protein
MSQFKHRSTKLKFLTTTKTLGEYHQEHMSNMKSNYKELEYISKAGDLIVDYYEKISGIHYDTYDNTDVDNNEPVIIDRKEIEIKKKKLETINEKNIIEESDIEQIYINPSHALKLLNLESQKKRKAKKPIKKRKLDNNISGGKSIFNFFVEENKDDCEKKNDEIKQPPKLNKTDYNISSLNRAELQDKFLFLIDKNYACTRVKNLKNIFCTRCNIEKTLFPSDGCYICQNCGETDDNIIMENETSNYKEITAEKQKYPYKKINHLKEKLNQFQSKETADVPDEVYTIIYNDLKKTRVPKEKISPIDIRSILKKHRQTVYYEHLQQIYCKITECPPITLSREIEEQIINMFQKIQDSFQKYRPNDRSNFLSYAYVLNKLFRIIKLEKHSKFFCLLKSKDKLREQDDIWEKICKDMGWKFYSSF